MVVWVHPGGAVHGHPLVPGRGRGRPAGVYHRTTGHAPSETPGPVQTRQKLHQLQRHVTGIQSPVFFAKKSFWALNTPKLWKKKLEKFSVEEECMLNKQDKSGIVPLRSKNIF